MGCLLYWSEAAEGLMRVWFGIGLGLVCDRIEFYLVFVWNRFGAVLGLVQA